MKKFFIPLMMCILCLIGCSQLDDRAVINQDAGHIAMRKENSNDNGKTEEEIKKEKLERLKEQTVYVDAMNAALGTVLAGGDVAIGVAVGLVASYEFYQAGLLSIESVIVADDKDLYTKYPWSINPFHPIAITGIDLDFPIDMDCAIVGYGHNAILREMYSSSDFTNPVSEELFIQVGNYIESVLPKISTQGIEWASEYANYQQIHTTETSQIYDFIGNFIPYLFSVPIEQLNWIAYDLLYNAAGIDDYSVCLSTAYYSRCLWNTVAPDPYIAQECLVWDYNEHTLEYVAGRDNVCEALSSDSHYVLFPAYDQETARVLYLYNERYGISYGNNIEQTISINNPLSFESPYYGGIQSTIEAGEYDIEPTDYEGLYYISLQ